MYWNSTNDINLLYGYTGVAFRFSDIMLGGNLLFVKYFLFPIDITGFKSYLFIVRFDHGRNYAGHTPDNQRGGRTNVDSEQFIDMDLSVKIGVAD